MDLQSIVGSSLMKQNQFLFDKKEYDRNMRALEQTRKTWEQRLERFQNLLMHLRRTRESLSAIIASNRFVWSWNRKVT
jgi:hypothetical protein